jgi:D-aspartate ligase
MNAPDALAAVSPKGALILGGAHGSLEIVRSLGRRGVPVWLITADNPLAGLSRYVQRNVSWPGPCSDGAAEFLVELGNRHGLKGWVLFAGSDADMRFVAQNHSTLGAVFTLTTQPWDKIRFAYDKRWMNARAAELGMARPLTRYPRNPEDLTEIGIPFPVILKPTVHETRNAFIDAKAWRADDQRMLAARYDEAKALVGADSIMIQEIIPGDGATQFSYAAVWDRGRPIGSLVAERCRQYPINFGFTSTLVETVERPEVDAAAARFLASLDFSGLVEIEFKYDPRDSSYKILDVNARAWTWMSLGAGAGIDFPVLQYRLAFGLGVAPITARIGARWLYLTRDCAASVAEMLAGRLSPTAYLRSLRHPSASAVFAWDDPLPGALDLPLSAVRVIARHLARRRRRIAAASSIAPITSSIGRPRQPAGTASAWPR